MARELKASFSASANIGVAPLSVEFLNTSSGSYDRVEWDFGDGNISTDINPIHEYMVPGNYSVRLTIHDPNLTDPQTIDTTVVVARPSSGSTNDQQALFVNKRFDAGQVAVREIVTTATEFTTQKIFGLHSNGYFDYDPGDDYTADLSPSSMNEISSLSGNNVIKTIITDAMQDSITGNSNTTSWYTLMMASSGSAAGYIVEAYPGTGATYVGDAGPILTYRIVDAIRESITYKHLNLDRDVPNTARDAPDSAYHSAGFVQIVNGDEGVHSTSKIDGGPYVKLAEVIDGADKFFFDGQVGLSGTANTHRGFISYLGYDGATGKSIAVIQYFDTASTENSWSPGSLDIRFPYIAHPISSSLGILTRDNLGDDTLIDANTGWRYRPLRAGLSIESPEIGRIFYDKHAITIEDSDVAAAMSPISNRNWVFPTPTATFVETASGDADAWVDTGTTYYVTYRLREDPNATADEDRWGLGASRLDPMPCLNVAKVSVPTASTGGYLTLTIPTQPWATGGTECVGSNTIDSGTRWWSKPYVAEWLDILVATGGTSGPDMTTWRMMTGDSTISDYTAYFSSNHTVDLKADTPFDPTTVSGLSYDWSAYGETLSGSSDMTFGLIQNYVPPIFLSGSYESSIYRMSAVCVAKNNEFNRTQNESFDAGNNNDIYITEVGLYNEDNELLMIGKLSQPIKKNEERFITVKIELDL